MSSLKYAWGRRAVVVAAAALAVGLSGCASTTSSTATAPKGDASPEALLKRAQAYWDLVRVNDNVGAWAYEAQSKAPNASLEAYLKKGGITYSSVNVAGVKSIEGDTGLVNVNMKYSLPLLRVRDRELRTEDQWKLIEGVWYHSPPRSGLIPTQ